jgi:hypothetical protein
MRQRLDDAELFGVRIWNRWKLKSMTLSLTANLTLLADAPPLINLDPTAARDVTLPAFDGDKVFLINHMGTGAFDLTIKNASAVTVGTISQNEAGLVIMTPTAAYLRLVGTST